MKQKQRHISAVQLQLICIFDFLINQVWFSHDVTMSDILEHVYKFSMYMYVYYTPDKK